VGIQLRGHFRQPEIFIDDAGDLGRCKASWKGEFLKNQPGRFEKAALGGSGDTGHDAAIKYLDDYQ